MCVRKFGYELKREIVRERERESERERDSQRERELDIKRKIKSSECLCLLKIGHINKKYTKK